MAWISDFFRLLWGLLYWNVRKSLYRRSPKGDRCPCQAPSDSGNAYETECEASHSWAKQKRFRAVCPLLVETPQGLRCSVSVTQVRPFWKRAIAIYAGGSFGIFIIAALLTFALLRGIGYPVRLSQVIWPPNWHEFHKVRADFFYIKGMEALDKGNFREGTMALTLAYQKDPSHYVTGLTLARFATITEPNRCDEMFRHLMLRHPVQSKTTAEQWLHSALVRGNFDVMRGLSLDRLAAGDKPSAPWIHAFIVATRKLKDNESLLLLAGKQEGAEWKPLLKTELLVRSGKKAEAEAMLLQSWFPPNPYFGYYQTTQLLALNLPDEALVLAGAYEQLMTGDNRASVVLAALARKGEQNRLLSDVATLLERRPLPPSVIELIALHLIRYPDSKLFGLVLSKLQTSRLSAGEAGDRAYLSLFCAAGILKEVEGMHQIKAMLRERSGSVLRALDAAEDFFGERNSVLRLDFFLPALPLSTEMNYALQEKFAPEATLIAPPSKQ